MESAVLGRSAAAAAALPLGRALHSWAIASDGSVCVAGRPRKGDEAVPKQDGNTMSLCG